MAGSRRDTDSLGWKVLGWTLDAFIGILILATAAGTRTMIRMDKTLQQQQTSQLNIVKTLDLVQQKLATQEVRLDEFADFKARTEANRFTIDDGKELVAQDLELWKEIAQVKEYIAKIPMEIPPAWLLEDVKLLQSDVKELRSAIHQVEMLKNM
jgi:hypothetical protein